MSGDETLLQADQAMDLGNAAATDVLRPVSGDVDPEQLPHLTVEHVETGHQHTAAIVKDRWMIGRALYSDLVLDHRSISAEHAVITREADGYRIDDLSSRNGTAVNGNAVGRSDLADGDLLELGVYRIVCHLPGAGALTLPSRRAPVVLEFLTGGLRGINQRFTQTTNEIAVGTDTLLLSRRENGWCLTHLAGDSEMTIDGRDAGRRAAPLRHASEIAVGKTRIRFLHL